MSDDIEQWSEAQDDIEDEILTELHEQEGAEELGHREGFCRACAANHLVAQRMSRRLWRAGWRPLPSITVAEHETEWGTGAQ